ncbi:hypothetical protein L226DRAFT_536873 [Lentinus tigrinus ALCF2SS1-7]|uniref:uncharacterized protein n=1 Tax=Lentinus tigrinus ALCF2SS1-7 TaxID=1328758 RepID=UPI001166392F|nr:hypothetical protein L226DRAFT_536873 [Lentinus tigrinus ALCF2SS1-7]
MSTVDSRCYYSRQTSPLPPELWGRVIQCLSNKDTRSFFSACRFFHDLAFPALFSHVVLRFGLWRADDEKNHADDDLEDSDQPDYGRTFQVVLGTEHKHEVAQNHMRTCEMLYCILHTPGFARVVRKLSVHAYILEDREGTFELYALREALLVMKNITSFHWDGRRPLPSAFVLDALAESSGHILRDLSLPYDNVTDSCLTKFTRLQTLALHRPNQYGVDVYTGGSDSVYISEVVKANQDTLKSLSLYGNAAWKCPVGSLLHLQELELILPVSGADFALILTQCADLRYLTLNISLGFNIELIDVLESHSAALPHLTAFKLLNANIPERLAASLATFLQNKKSLRMLDLACKTDHGGGVALPLLEVLPQLPALDVLGLTRVMSGDEMEGAEIDLLGRYIPECVSALMLRLDVERERTCSKWIDLVAKLPALRYLHILDSEICDGLKTQLRENLPRLRSLELLGFGPYVRWVERGDSERDMVRLGDAWRFRKVRFCTAEDFGCHADWEWLFRHHALGALELQ